MQRRDFLRAAAALGLPATLAACGGGTGNGGNGGAIPKITGFTSDKQQYFYGDRAILTPTFSGGAGRIEPGSITVTSGSPVTVGPLSTVTSYRLIVSGGASEAVADIGLNVSYRNTFATVQMGFARASHVAVEGDDGRILIIGGEDNGSAFPSDVMAFHPQNDTFARIGALTTGRVQHTATTLGDGTVLIYGGSRALTGTPIAERFNPRTGQSRATNTQPASNRQYHTATLLADGRVMIAGGYTPGGGLIGDTVEIFDPQTEQFTRLSMRLAVRRYGHTAMRITTNHVLLYGGITSSGAAAAPELYDVQGQSSSIMPMPGFEQSARFLAAGVKLAGGNFLSIGGDDFTNAQPQRTVARIAGGGLAITPGGQLQLPRTLLAAAPLADGRALVTGGATTVASIPTATTELLSPNTGTSVTGPAMATARLNHTASLMINGKVLVIGGNGPDRSALATAEIYG